MRKLSFFLTKLVIINVFKSKMVNYLLNAFSYYILTISKYILNNYKNL